MRRTVLAIVVMLLLIGVAPSPASPADLPASDPQVDPTRTATVLQVADDVGGIFRLYVAYFDRAPDAGGLWFWVDQQHAGLDLASISDRFAGSPEFVDRYGSVDDEAFVALVYEAVLGRQADTGGLAHWRNEMAAGLSRGALMIQFSESIEFRTTTGFLNAPEIERLYSAVFLRSPDRQGLNFWLAERSSGMSLDAIATLFTNSPEFVDRYGAIGDEAFVDLVYLNILGRSPDATGRAFWVGQLDSITRGELLIGFSNSPEYQSKTGIVDLPAPMIPERPSAPPNGGTVPPQTTPPPIAPVTPPPPLPELPVPSYPCNFEVGDAGFFGFYYLESPYQAGLRYTFDMINSDCRRWAQDGVLTLRGASAGDWEFTNHGLSNNNYPQARASLGVNIPESAFDADLGINIDASYVFGTGSGGSVELSWNDYVYLPLSYVIESDNDPDPIPFEQMTASVPVTVQANPQAPNRPITVQVRKLTSRPGCVPLGWQEGDGWIDIATGVAPLSLDVAVDLTNEIGSCQLEVRVDSGVETERLKVHRLSPNVEDFTIGGSSTCPEGSCDTTLTFHLVNSRGSYSAYLIPLADVRGNAGVDFDTALLDSGQQTFAMPHSYVDGFCVSLWTVTGSSSFLGSQTPYRCFEPDNSLWAEVPLPEDRFS